MKYLLLYLLLFYHIFNSPMVSAQEVSVPKLKTESLNQYGLLLISNFQNWKYHPGDNLIWAKPDYDDSNWHLIAPAGLSIGAMPDSLWNGYGWWRFKFTADSSFYDKNWNLYFFGWGAAEVYLDGKLIHQFENFSADPDNERTFSPTFKVLPPINITKKYTHTIAVRYSYHQAKHYNFYMRGPAGNLGFMLGFGTHQINENIVKINSYVSFTLFVSSAALFILLLLHLILLVKFPGDKTNLYLSIVFASMLVSVIAVYNPIYANLTRYWSIIFEMIWAKTVTFSILFLPFVIVSLFRLEKLKKVILLLAFFPILAFNSYYWASYQGNYLSLAVFLLTFVLIGYICFRAYKEKKKGVHFVAFGALGTLTMVFIHLIYILGYIQMSSLSFFITIAFLYTLFPIGLTLYVADRYGYMFTSLEIEVGERTHELQKSNNQLEESLSDLKAAQVQLIQQEKLASLGQLTAGIAHEIKNPLNFVNNFSDVSIELIDEAIDEVKAQGLALQPQEDIIEILSDIKSNLRKIHEHGSRADSIVRSMLLHSRGGTGKMEPTDLNTLIREYVNLSFHGMRAGKDPINVDIQFDLDESIDKVNLVGEDFSRVILNLCNNAFDAMRAVSKERLAVLKVRSKRQHNNITIEIEDNGPGIPDEIKDKILQPFFTTKKGTEGTGLGLSISHDVVKAHGGIMEVESTVNEGTLFKIILNKQ